MSEAKKQSWRSQCPRSGGISAGARAPSQDMAWTTPLGNAFLAQQSDVMQAVQRMRAQAQSRGGNQSTSQQTVTTQSQNGQNAISIEPANADVWYVPNYNPAYIWGPPVYGIYPSASLSGNRHWIRLGPWHRPGLVFRWMGRAGDGVAGAGRRTGTTAASSLIIPSFTVSASAIFTGSRWAAPLGCTTPQHRLGVPYANRQVASRFAARAGSAGPGVRPGSGAERFGSPGFEQRGYTNNHSVFGGYHDGAATRMQSDHGFSSMGGGRTFGGGGGGGGFHGGGGGGRR